VLAIGGSEDDQPATMANASTLRGLGWDITRRFPRKGEFLPVGSFGRIYRHLNVDRPFELHYIILVLMQFILAVRERQFLCVQRLQTIAAAIPGPTPAEARWKSITGYNESIISQHHVESRIDWF
jgi:hypothetical protein